MISIVMRVMRVYEIAKRNGGLEDCNGANSLGCQSSFHFLFCILHHGELFFVRRSLTKRLCRRKLGSSHWIILFDFYVLMKGKMKKKWDVVES